MNRNLILIQAMTLSVLAGCSSPRHKFSPDPLSPVVQVIPPQGNFAPKVAEAPDQPEAIYQNPVIEEVEMAAYINEDGNLVFPGKLLVIREPGHWNLGAAQKNRQYYVPADNQPPQLLPPSKSYYDYIQSKKNGAVTAHLDVSQVRVTGYTQKEERQNALTTLRPGETLAFDAFLGWLAIPDEKPIKLEEEVRPSTHGTNAPVAPSPDPNPPPTANRTTDTADPQQKLNHILDDAFKKTKNDGRTEQAPQP